MSFPLIIINYSLMLLIFHNYNVNGQIPLVRLPSNTLLKYTSYKDVSILHFRIPTDTRTALFSFKAYEESKSAFQRICEPRDVTLYLKAGSYPVISPENITFPRHFLSAEQRFEIYDLQFQSDSVTRHLSIDGPNPGNWFAVAFISWTDPNNDRIEQQGLAASCETLLLSEMSIIRATPIMISDGIIYKSLLQSNVTEPISFKFFVPYNVLYVTWKLSIQNACLDCPDVCLFVQADALPSVKNYLQDSIVYPNQTGDLGNDFYPHENTWHYIDIDFLMDADDLTLKNVSATANENNETVLAKHQLEFTIVVTYQYAVDDTQVENTSITNTSNINEDEIIKEELADKTNNLLSNRLFENYPLLRQTYREFFMFDYDLLPDNNGTVPLTLNLTAGHPALLKFDVGDVYDIGGTLSFAVAMQEDNKGNLFYTYYGGHIKTVSAVNTERRRDSTTSPTDAVAEKLVDSSTENNHRFMEDMKQSQHQQQRTKVKNFANNQTIIICMRLGEPGIPTWPDKCVYGHHTFPAASIINNTNVDTSTGLVHIPFPESGMWHVTMGLFCHGAETAARITIIDSVKDFIRKHQILLDGMSPPCACAANANNYHNCISEEACLKAMNETETLKVKECIMDSKCTSNYQEMSKKFEIHHKYATEQSVGINGSCNASVVFTISSSPCVAGRCGRYGRCYHYMSGGFVFSTCLCIKGYRGWDCTEDSQVPSSISILMASLLLTLSNLLFIPSIYFAIRRKYYTEGVIYFFAMFFSTFYHACDSGEDEYSFCLVKIGVLQFCDFYCGLLAIWVTLIAMSHVRQTFVSLLHMIGAILLAFGTELNKQSLWVFLAPALTGICLISVSWGIRCKRTRKLFPSKRYLAIYLPLGAVFVMIGLSCYAFLQTKQNYHIVHSIWHMVMALSILCLLPNRKTFLPKC